MRLMSISLLQATLLLLLIIVSEANNSMSSPINKYRLIGKGNSGLSEMNGSTSALVIKHREKRLIGMIILGVVGVTVVAASSATTAVLVLAEEKRKKKYMAEQEERCHANCVGDWSPWSECTQPCGGGRQKRTRRLQIPGYCRKVKKFSCLKELMQTAPCNPGCPHGGWLKRGGGGCECPDGREGICCEREVRCNHPGSLKYGEVDGIFPAVFGTVVTYSCNEGFKRLRGSREIQCLKNGTWSGRKPRCVALQCEIPNQPDNGYIINIAPPYYYNQEIMYACNEGYVMIGPQIRKCSKLNEEAAWTDFPPKCEETFCGDLEYPTNGKIAGSDFSLGGIVHISCKSGYRLSGSTERHCQASGRWSGHETHCLPISCEPPVAPEHGQILPTKSLFVFGRYITVRCDPGYELKGRQKLTCVRSNSTSDIGGGGMWDYETPTCEAVSCGDPGVPLQGAKDGNSFMHPQNITFTCFSGYILNGSAEIHCTSTGLWSASIPSCIACPVNTYKANTLLDSPCETCPSNTHTVTVGSTDRDQCVCNRGYQADNQGVCQEIRCQPLSGPSNGSLASCDNRLDSICQITCDDGFVMQSGASKRQCLEDSSWSGLDATCRACPINTFKGTERICVPCPTNSHTNQEAQSEGSCICDDGFETGEDGGTCVDINECEANGGRGPCSDTCMNRNGSYYCDCSIPGYVISQVDRHDCILSNTCRNLTQEDAPEHGGLICHWYKEQNSQQCGIRCNRGYEFPVDINNYEHCGPNTNYLWTHEVRDEEIEDCLEEFLGDIHVGADSFYFVSDCNTLTSAEQQEVKQQFADVLTRGKVCVMRKTRICDVKNIEIICGDSKKRRRKRSIDGVDVEQEEEVNEVTIHMDMETKSFNGSFLNCGIICPKLKIPAHKCPHLCVKTYKRYLRAVALYSKRKLEALYRNASAVSFAAAERNFEAVGVATSDIISDCEPGMRSVNNLCVPCSKGSFHDREKNECTHCSPGSYQPLEKQTSCLSCPIGTTSNKTRATSCNVCTNGTYGEQCREMCGPCVNGQCHPVTGKCECHSGWEGDACDLDIQGCTLNSCFPGVQCWDVVAPATGFACGECPEGTRGDGIFCEIIPFDDSESYVNPE